MVISLALGRGVHRILGGHVLSQLELVGMTIYTPKQLQELLSVGRGTAYVIMKRYGFRIGESERSPLRISEQGVEQYVKDSLHTKGPNVDAI